MKNIICFETKYGWINAVEEGSLVTSISFGKVKNENSSSQLLNLQSTIEDYFEGFKISNSFNLQVQGSDLQKAIWKEIAQIPFGQTRTYNQIAKKLKTSPRYVGTVCGQNKHLIIVPCHRVIRSDGTLGGYSALGGMKLKVALLNMEKKNNLSSFTT